MSRTTVRVQYHEEADSWWADSADMDGYTALGSTLAETRRLVREGIPFFLDVPADQVNIEEVGPGGRLVYSYDLSLPPTVAPHTEATVAPSRPSVRGHSFGKVPVFAR